MVRGNGTCATTWNVLRNGKRRLWALSIQQKSPVQIFGFFAGRTRPTAFQNSKSRALQHMAYWLKLCCLKMADFFNIFAALEQGDCETISCTILDRNDDVILLATVACFMRKGLTFVNGYFEVAIPAYLSGEFENHFRMTGQRVSHD